MGRAPVLSRSDRERALLTAGAILLFLTGYFGAGLIHRQGRARDVATALDARIPFIAGSVWVYLAVFPASLLPLFVVRDPRLFRKTVAAYAAAFAVAVTVFAVFPVGSQGLRAPPSALDVRSFSGWGVARLYRLDPPNNLFPSLHVAIALLAAASAFKASRAYGAAALALAVPIGLSILTVKQHFVLDGVAGILLAACVWAAILRPYDPAPEHASAYGWRGPAAYAVTVAAFYAGVYAWFRLAA